MYRLRNMSPRRLNDGCFLRESGQAKAVLTLRNARFGVCVIVEPFKITKN